MQPSGKPHLGNYLGAMKPHIELQNEFECFYFIANYHALTTVRDQKKLAEMTQELAIDYLALGIDPKKTVFFKQSDIPEVTELTWILSTITPFGLLERAHAWKDAIAKGKKNPTAGLFIYPVLMASDILAYQSDLVPVGKDQKQHIEIARDIALTFNSTYGETFKLPQDLIDKNVETILGTDGVHKMSKSYGNTVDIFADEAEFSKQVMSMVTDPARIKRTDIGHPEICNVFALQKIFNLPKIKEIERKCREGKLGCVENKKFLCETIFTELKNAREKRIELRKNLDYIDKVLNTGAKKARKVATETLDRVKRHTGL
ncbi:MAG: Tryptophan-tRNA ligase [Candidatus Peregrinibacteria bacterium GW2011_GWA2_43_8]|nr:MAG: Tryptophan-tRNA ligase [Candidatus Peregrinibacteria bacterium GW2011_GWA2_43_8]